MKNVKKLVSMLLAIIIMLGTMAPYMQVDAEESEVTIVDIKVTTEDTMLEGVTQESTYWDPVQGDVAYDYYEVSWLNYRFEIFYSDGSSEVLTRDELINKFGDGGSVNTDQAHNPWKVGLNDATFSFLEKEYTFQVEVVANPIASISAQAQKNLNADIY